MFNIVNLSVIILSFFKVLAWGTTLDPDDLMAGGIIMKDGMHYCDPLSSYVKPTEDELMACAFAVNAKIICSFSPNTRWISGRCFCPEQNKYFDEMQNEYEGSRTKITDPNAESLLNSLSSSVKRCPSFKPRKNPFGRSVVLLPTETGFKVESPSGLWFNLDDKPGEQGNPHWPATIARVLGIDLGFGNENGMPLMPDFKTLVRQAKKIAPDIGFFEVDGQLSGEEYLKAFVRGKLPIARIEPNGDATFLLHDMSFHAMALALLPEEIRKLAQRQTFYLLDFIDYFSEHYQEEYKQPKFKYLMQMLIENQVKRIDVATGRLTQNIYDRLRREKSWENFSASFMELSCLERGLFQSEFMAITSATMVGPDEKRSVKRFLKDIYYWSWAVFDWENEYNEMQIFKEALSAYIVSQEKTFKFAHEIEIDSTDDIYNNRPPKFGRSAVDLFIGRVNSLRRASVIVK